MSIKDMARQAAEANAAARLAEYERDLESKRRALEAAATAWLSEHLVRPVEISHINPRGEKGGQVAALLDKDDDLWVVWSDDCGWWSHSWKGKTGAFVARRREGPGRASFPWEALRSTYYPPITSMAALGDHIAAVEKADAVEAKRRGAHA